MDLSRWLSGVATAASTSSSIPFQGFDSHHHQQLVLEAAEHQRQLQKDKQKEDEEDNKQEDPPAEEEEDDDNNNNDDQEEMVDETKDRMELVKLVPFDVRLSLAADSSEALNTFALTDLVSDWMDESLAAQVKRMELGLTHSAFDSVILEERSIQNLRHRNRRQLRRQTDTTRTLQQQDGTTIASYEGVTLWKHAAYSDLLSVTPSLLEDIERQALLQDGRLLELLQASSAQGLGASVTDVRAYINLNPNTATTNAANNNSNSTNANLELIIVVAIVVACMAFAFLVFSLFWAWRFDQQRRQEAYRVEANTSPQKGNTTKKRKPRSPDGTGGTDNSEYDDDTRVPPNVVAVDHNQTNDDDTALEYPASETNPTTGNYPESVISDDISTSLTAYYRSGMGSRPIFTPRALPGGVADDFNDQASFSSMESYGYSLDGYAPSLAGNTYAKAQQKSSSDVVEDTSEMADK